jgi:hypothetical protein
LLCGGFIASDASYREGFWVYAAQIWIMKKITQNYRNRSLLTK